MDKQIRSRPKELRVHYLSHEDRALVVRVIEALERWTAKFCGPKEQKKEAVGASSEKKV